MKATGEVMAIDRSFEAALQKALRSLEVKGQGVLWEDRTWVDVVAPDTFVDRFLSGAPTDDRLWRLLAALRRGASVERIHERTHIDRWFLRKMAALVRFAEGELQGRTPTPALLGHANRLGFADADIATLAGRLRAGIRRLRAQWGIAPVYKMVDTCAAEFQAVARDFFSTYEQENEAEPLAGEKVLILGSGPIRIGQGIEFDCCRVQSAGALQERGVAPIMVNSNPETVSTDFDASARLYFQPLHEEAIASVSANERAGEPEGAKPLPTVVQFGGQTALNLADRIAGIGGEIAGTSADAIALAEDRRRFHDFADALGIPQPPGGTAESLAEALAVAGAGGYPVLARPSYVLGGRGMEIAYSAEDLERYFHSALEAGNRRGVRGPHPRAPGGEGGAPRGRPHTLVARVIEHIERARG